MTKKLKIRFEKLEKALAVQILEQTGDFADSAHIRIDGRYGIYFGNSLWCGKNKLKPEFCLFDSNDVRDGYLNTVINWITNEQFANGAAEPKIDGDVYIWEMEVADER